MSVPKEVLKKSIRFYQQHITVHTPATCKFYPTCSQYGYEAIDRYGAVKGTAMTAWRIVRCSPLTSGGYDPVPEEKEYY